MLPPNKALQLTSTVGRPSASLWRSQLNAGTLARPMALDIPVRFDGEPLLWTVEDVYSKAECDAFIRRIEELLPTIATNNPLYRDQDRVIVDDAVVAEDLFRRLRPHL